jgi:aminopeptidase-like protein
MPTPTRDDRYAQLLTDLWPLHRTLISDDMDRAMGLIHDFLTKQLGVPANFIQVHEFPSGTEVSTWIVPKKFTIRDYALVETGGTRDRVLVDRSKISLSVADYSQPVDTTLSWDEMRPHLFVSERRPEAIPFVFKYFYRENYGFCLPKTTFDTIDKSRRFRAVLDTEFTPGTLKCLEVVLPGDIDDALLVMSNVCHPHQVNDSITGALNALMLVEEFLARPRRHTLRFGFWPETIGAMAYFAKYREQRRSFRFGMFTEMLGTSGPHALQYSRQEGTTIDRAADWALAAVHRVPFHAGRYTTVLRNDERISNGINLDIPTISLSRYPYAEYHTSDDNPSIIDMKNLRESFEISRTILTLVDENVTLVPEDFLFGQPFLTRYGLFHDPPLAGGDADRNLNKIMEDVFSYSDGRTSLLDIATRFRYPWSDVLQLGRSLVEKGLFRAERPQ